MNWKDETHRLPMLAKWKGEEDGENVHFGEPTLFVLRIFYTWSETQIFETDIEMGAGSGISGKRALSSLRVCSTVRNILPPQDGLILRPSHAVPDGRRAASEMSDNVQLFPWETWSVE